jgi:hypothetical protein
MVFSSDDGLDTPLWAAADEADCFAAAAADVGATTAAGAYKLVFERAQDIMTPRIGRVRATRRAAAVARRLSARVHAAYAAQGLGTEERARREQATATYRALVRDYGRLHRVRQREIARRAGVRASAMALMMGGSVMTAAVLERLHAFFHEGGADVASAAVVSAAQAAVSVADAELGLNDGTAAESARAAPSLQQLHSAARLLTELMGDRHPDLLSADRA